jgi:hypothetical protein
MGPRRHAVWGGARLLRRRPLPGLAAGMVGVLLLGFAAFVMGTHPLWGVVLAQGTLRWPLFRPTVAQRAPGLGELAKIRTHPTGSATPNARVLCSLAERQGDCSMRWC